jgi:arylsulfatase
MKQHLTTLTSCLLICVQAIAADKPNIILVMPDDVGYGDYACLGNPIIRTPSVDAFKKQSLLLTQFHVSPTCAPTRSALMSGRHEFNKGVTHTVLERERLSLKTYTLPQMLKSAGYTSGIFGKWHLGDEAAYRPESRGFDEVYIHGCGGIGQIYPGSCGDAPGNTNINPTLWHNGKFEKTTGYCTDLFFSQAIKWMDVKRTAKQPFFAYITPNAAHLPHVVPKEYYERYLGKTGVNENTAKFLGMIENVDTNFGKLLAKLDEWGIADNTLVIYLGGDNGGTDGRAIFDAGLRGSKVTVWQGGTRAAAFFRWPKGKIPAGAECDALSAHIDLFPTLAGITGANLTAEVKPQVEGRGLLPILKNRMGRPHARASRRALAQRQGRRGQIQQLRDPELPLHPREQLRALRPQGRPRREIQRHCRASRSCRKTPRCLRTMVVRSAAASRQRRPRQHSDHQSVSGTLLQAVRWQSHTRRAQTHEPG